MIRTLVVAPRDLARAALADLVRADSRLELAGEADATVLARQIRALEPDVVLEDRDGGGDADAVPVGTASIPTVALVDDPYFVWSRDVAIGEPRGARAILSRDAAPSEIVAAIVAVAAGLIALQPRALDSPDARARPHERLTARETDVLRELSRGAPNKTIATRLNISDHTVKFHVAAIFAKLGVASRTEAVAYGVRMGLVML